MRQRILSVDDNEIIGWTLTARLWAAGYEVESVCSAADAFEALGRTRYDLVLMDLEMPGCGGLEALSVIREEGLCPEVPVVLLTSSEHFGHIQKAYALGAQGYLTKGYASTNLDKVVDRLMGTDDVIWIDDMHCVSKQGVDEAAALDGPGAGSSAAVRERPSAPRLTLVSTLEDSTYGGRRDRTLAVC